MQQAPAGPASCRPDPLPDTGLPKTAQGRWAPIIAGTPIFDFEPRPPLYDAYRPDTISDGWSTKHFAVRLASVRGYSHRYRGTPRQDEAAAAVAPGSETVLFAVADGVSSAPKSHVGAAAACQAAITEAASQLSSTKMVDWSQVVNAAVRELIARAADIPAMTSRP